VILVNAYCEDSTLKTEIKAEQSHPPHIFHANKKQSFFFLHIFSHDFAKYWSAEFSSDKVQDQNFSAPLKDEEL